MKYKSGDVVLLGTNICLLYCDREKGKPLSNIILTGSQAGESGALTGAPLNANINKKLFSLTDMIADIQKHE